MQERGGGGFSIDQSAGWVVKAMQIIVEEGWLGLGWLWYGHGDRDMAFTIYLLHILKKNNVVSVQVQFISVLVLVPIITSCIHNI